MPTLAYNNRVTGSALLQSYNSGTSISSTGGPFPGTGRTQLTGLSDEILTGTFYAPVVSPLSVLTWVQITSRSSSQQVFTLSASSQNKSALSFNAAAAVNFTDSAGVSTAFRRARRRHPPRASLRATAPQPLLRLPPRSRAFAAAAGPRSRSMCGRTSR